MVRAIKKPARGSGRGVRFLRFRLGGAHHPVPAREGMVVVPVVVIMDAKRPVAEAAIRVIIMLAKWSSTGGVRLKIVPQGVPRPRIASTPKRTNFSRNGQIGAISPANYAARPKWGEFFRLTGALRNRNVKSLIKTG